MNVTPLASCVGSIVLKGDSSVCSGLRISSDTLLRAARNDGWMSGGGDLGDPEALDRFINRLKQFREDEGRTGPFGIHAMSLDADKPDGIKRLARRGPAPALPT
jgi:hypothetical protein